MYGDALSKMTPNGTVTNIPIRDGKVYVIACDGNGVLYLEGEGVINKIGADGKIAAFVSSAIQQPGSLAFDHSGNLFVANGNNTIGKIAPDGTGTVFQAGCCSLPSTNGLSGELAFD